MSFVWFKMSNIRFTLEEFLNNPSIELVHACRKDDLLSIAAHFDISVQKSLVKKEIKKRVLEELANLKVLTLSPAPPEFEFPVEGVPSPSTEVFMQSAQEPAVPVTPPMRQIEKVAPATLPRFDPLSPPLLPALSSQDPKLKVRLTRLQLEAQEKESQRKAEYDLRLQVRKFEIEAEKEVRLKELEVEALKITSGHSLTPSDGTPSFQMGSKQSFDVSKNISLVPAFCEAEVDSYFNAFERIASALNWPRDVADPSPMQASGKGTGGCFCPSLGRQPTLRGGKRGYFSCL